MKAGCCLLFLLLAISIVSDLFNVYNGLLLLAPYSVGCCLLFVFFRQAIVRPYSVLLAGL
jgi:hypothetical protein